MPLFERHYTVTEANALLPELRRWLAALQDLDHRYSASHDAVSSRLDKRRYDAGGPELARHYGLWVEWQAAAEKILEAGVQVKDLDRGLVDFPHLLPETGEEVFLCWELSEPRIGHWHPIDTGYAGRQPLDDLPG